MAQRKIITLIDDLDPTGETEADETVTFGLDGKTYEIDLTADNAHRLRSRLKEFKQAARLVKDSGPRRTARPLTEPAGDGATYSRHQGGVDPAKARAWAIKHGIPVPTKGRLGKDIKDAYNAYDKFGDKGPLNKLLAPQNGESAPQPAKDTEPPQPAPSDPQEPTDTLLLDLTPQPAPEPKPEPTPALKDPVTEFAEAVAENNPPQESDETEAATHYEPLTQLSPDATKKKWNRRTAHGCERTDKVADMTLMERVQAIGNGGSDRNITILGMLAGVIPLKNGKVSFLPVSAARLENLEMIQYSPDSDHGWEITPFGRYAHKYHSMG